MEQYKQDRRRSPRVKVNLPVYYWEGERVSKYQTTDVSLSGFRILTDRPFDELTRYELNLQLLDDLTDEIIVFEAMPVRNELISFNESKFAVAFYITKISSKDKVKLSKFIESRIYSFA